MKRTDTSDSLGKVPPQAIEIEEAVLGAMILDSACLDEVFQILSGKMFYMERHKSIFEAVEVLYKAKNTVDSITLYTYLRDCGTLDAIGGLMYLNKLTSKVISSANIQEHCLIVKQKYIQREMIRIGSELEKRGFDPYLDVKDLIEYAEKELYDLGGMTDSKEAKSIGFLLNTIADLIAKREKSEARLVGIPSGITELDRITLGWQPGDLIIIASRPSMGKSALGIQFAKVAAQMEHPVLLLSLEMTDIQLGERYLSTETGADTYDIKQGRNIDWHKIESSLNSNRNVPLWIDDSPHMNIYEFRSKVRKAKKKYGIELVICDYLSLFTGDESKDNMSEKYGSISKMFKSVAKECEVAVIALAQLNRSTEMRASQLPKLSDLRNSGEIEQDADIVIFPVRYKVIGIDHDDKGRDLSEMARIDIAKNRNGRLGILNIRVSHDCMQWGIATDEDYFGEVETQYNPEEFTESKAQKELPY